MPPEDDVVVKDSRSLLLEALVAQAGGAEGSGVLEMLSQLGGADSDPALGLIARYLAQSQAESDETSDEEYEEELLEQQTELDRARAEERARAFQRLRQTMEQMYRELETLRERNDTLAEALGACHLCWGEDIECPVCSGTGHPGASMPDRAMLVELVTPAVQRLRRRGGRPSGGPLREEDDAALESNTEENLSRERGDSR